MDEHVLEWQFFQSAAFPTSEPFWRCVCGICGWMSIPHAKKPSKQIQCPQCRFEAQINDGGFGDIINQGPDHFMECLNTRSE